MYQWPQHPFKGGFDSFSVVLTASVDPMATSTTDSCVQAPPRAHNAAARGGRAAVRPGAAALLLSTLPLLSSLTSLLPRHTRSALLYRARREVWHRGFAGPVQPPDPVPFPASCGRCCSTTSCSQPLSCAAASWHGHGSVQIEATVVF